MQNCTLRDNVLFGKEYHAGKYDAIINACALRSVSKVDFIGNESNLFSNFN